MGTFAKKGMKGFINDRGELDAETEAWNIAQFYVGSSIAIPLRELNELEDIARFGSVKIDEDLLMNDNHFNKRRADAVKRYWGKIKQIVVDTKFKVKKKDRSKMEEIHKWIMTIPTYFDGLLKINKNFVTHEENILVNEDFLIKVLDALVDKKEKLLSILHSAGLIFRESSEIDLDKISNEFIYGG